MLARPASGTVNTSCPMMLIVYAVFYGYGSDAKCDRFINVCEVEVFLFSMEDGIPVLEDWIESLPPEHVNKRCCVTRITDIELTLG